jgi:hypothetical protein
MQGFNYALVVSNYTSGMMGTGKKPVESPCEVRVTIFKKLGYLRVGNFFYLFISWGWMRLSSLGI